MRSPKNPKGLCMIICSPFRDTRTRLQALMRVGRYTDKAWRIQNSLVDHVDKPKQAIYKGKLKKETGEIKKLIIKDKAKKPVAQKSVMKQAEENQKSHQTIMRENQILEL
jgi:23S rRNA-/tRNA-specific pseudouridylate synthase